MIPVIVIDSTARRVTLDLVHDDTNSQLLTLQKIVGGYIEHVYTFANRDLLMVNEDGRILSPVNKRWFRLPECPEPYAGNGVIVGGSNQKGDMTPVRGDVERIKRLILFAEHFT